MMMAHVKAKVRVHKKTGLTVCGALRLLGGWPGGERASEDPMRVFILRDRMKELEGSIKACGVYRYVTQTKWLFVEK